MSGWTILCIMALTVGSLVTSLHIVWLGRRIGNLERRVHDLEMQLRYPDIYPLFREESPD